MNARYEQSLSEERKTELQRRNIKELVEFLSPQVQIGAERTGGQEISLCVAGGSTGPAKEVGKDSASVLQTPFVVTPKESKINKIFWWGFKYNSCLSLLGFCS